MRHSDIIFFSTIILSMLIALPASFLGYYQDWMTYWWVILVPIAFSKAFFPSSKFSNWLEKNYESKKNKE